jgi:hypothetical protein
MRGVRSRRSPFDALSHEDLSANSEVAERLASLDVSLEIADRSPDWFTFDGIDAPPADRQRRLRRRVRAAAVKPCALRVV